MPLVLSGVVLFGVPVPLLLGIWPCGLDGVGIAVVFGLVVLGVSLDGVVAVVPVDIDEPLDIELLMVPLAAAPVIEPLDVVPVLVLPGLESCC